MCHLILLLPLLVLPALWLLPTEAAIAAVVVIAVLSVAMYALIIKGMRAPVVTGPQCVLHALGTVRAVERGMLCVWVQSELWSAETDDVTLKAGDTVEVVAIKGVNLKVRKAPAASDTPSRTLENALRYHPH